MHADSNSHKGARIRKFVVSSAHVILIWLSVKALFGGIAGGVAAGCLIASALWLLLAAITLPRLFRNYYDAIARARTWFMVGVGSKLAVGALIAAVFLAQWMSALFALPLLAAWYVVATAARRHMDNFVLKGFGYLPKDIWVNPPAESLAEGDLILTSGRIARQTRNSVGHVELVLRRQGKLVAFSSYMEKGIVFHTVRALCASEVKNGSHYVVMRPRRGFTAAQNDSALKRADEMHAINKAWKQSQTRVRTARVERLLPPALCRVSLLAQMKTAVLSRYLPTGYDWWGTYMGSRFNDRWTCMGAVLEVLRVSGVPTAAYGKGLFGLGTGLFTPLMPVRVISDANFVPLRNPQSGAGK